MLPPPSMTFLFTRFLSWSQKFSRSTASQTKGLIAQLGASADEPGILFQELSFQSRESWRNKKNEMPFYSQNDIATFLFGKVEEKYHVTPSLTQPTIRAVLRKWPNITLISAIAQTGEHWFAILRGTNTSSTFVDFLKMLMAQLEVSEPDWRSKYLFVFDNAAMHTSRVTMSFLLDYQVPFIPTGVASYSALPVEMMFSHIKRRFQGMVQKYDLAYGLRHIPVTTVCELIDLSARSISGDLIMRLFPKQFGKLSNFLR